jgi:hypothetical protein
VDEARDAATLCVTMGTGPLTRPPLIPERWRARSGQTAAPAYEYELQSCYTLFAGQSRIERTATVNRLGGADILASTYARLQGFLFQVPNAVVGLVHRS